MAKSYQFGYEHYLYLPKQGSQASPTPSLLTEVTESDSTGVNKITWDKDFATIRDASFSGSPNTIDIATRQEARLGVQSQAIVTTARTFEFQIRYKPHDGTSFDIHYQRLLDADLRGDEVALLEVDGKVLGNTGQFLTDTTHDIFGFASNYTVSTTMSKPLQDLVVVDVTATASTFFHAVVYEDGQTPGSEAFKKFEQFNQNP
jgi:hypothetical protein